MPSVCLLCFNACIIPNSLKELGLDWPMSSELFIVTAGEYGLSRSWGVVPPFTSLFPSEEGILQGWRI